MSTEVPKQSRIPSARLTLVSILVGLTGSFHFGMQLTATNPSHNSFLQFVNSSVRDNYQLRLDVQQLEALWSAIVALLFVGAIGGSLLIRPLSDRLGRLRSLFFGNALSTLFLLGCVFAYFRKSVEFLAFARLGLGFSLALCLGVAGIFLAECSPKRCRGSVSMGTGVLLQLGTIVGSIAGIPSVLGSPRHWWLIFGLEAAQLFGTTILLAVVAYESPGYLLRKGKEERAQFSLEKYHNCKGRTLESRMDELREEIARMLGARPIGFRKLISTPGANRQAAVGCVVALAMAFSGIAVINAFAVELFQATGLSQRKATLANVALSVLSMVANIASAFLIDRYGRRPLLLSTLATILTVNVVISGLMLGYDQTQQRWLGICLIGAIAIFVVAFSIGPGPICYFLPAELVEQNARSAAQGLATLGQMSSRAFLLTIFLPLRNAIGEGFAYFSLFVLPILLALLFLFFRLPETKNRNLSEVRRGMQKLPQCPMKIATTQRHGKNNSNTKSNNKIVPKRGWNSVVANDDRKIVE